VHRGRWGRVALVISRWESSKEHGRRPRLSMLKGAVEPFETSAYMFEDGNSRITRRDIYSEARLMHPNEGHACTRLNGIVTALGIPGTILIR